MKTEKRLIARKSGDCNAPFRRGLDLFQKSGNLIELTQSSDLIIRSPRNRIFALAVVKDEDEWLHALFQVTAPGYNDSSDAALIALLDRLGQPIGEPSPGSM
ncbi:hypothetical protein [Paraburkholderia sp. RL17-337-BIB-A]|uniref:hypothetical protein n=1 Tax=Paraburkholderia sp. RL17-337-BIB-A TaxID=3031636 RepID=UPI0038B6FA63